MRSSSLKVYSPAEYTGYKEKEAATRRNREAAQAIEKTTRKPKPILYRLRRFASA